jgi:hypothetical protein
VRAEDELRKLREMGKMKKELLYFLYSPAPGWVLPAP